MGEVGYENLGEYDYDCLEGGGDEIYGESYFVGYIGFCFYCQYLEFLEYVVWSGRVGIYVGRRRQFGW